MNASTGAMYIVDITKTFNSKVSAGVSAKIIGLISSRAADMIIKKIIVFCLLFSVFCLLFVSSVYLGGNHI
jgi:hypothetical protein